MKWRWEEVGGSLFFARFAGIYLDVWREDTIVIYGLIIIIWIVMMACQ